MKPDASMLFALMAAWGGWYLTRDGSSLPWTRAFDYGLVVTGVVGFLVLRVRRALHRRRRAAGDPPAGDQPSRPTPGA